MNCKCKYFNLVDGKLVCSVCGKPAHEPVIEDKIDHKPENKARRK
jgi:uncharacterized Zn finger protein (UPF0148 family)